MPNPSPGVYQLIANGVAYGLFLNFDAQWNIVNSSVGDTPNNTWPIQGKYDPATGKIEFNFARRVPLLYIRSYFGYVLNAYEMAGVFDQMVLVFFPPPANTVTIENVEHGWWAILEPS
jgi:hypothetical protein